MSRMLVLYLGSVMLRSIGVAAVAGLFTLAMRSAARRHASWAAVLAIMILIPAADRIVPAVDLRLPFVTTEQPVWSWQFWSTPDSAVSATGHATVHDLADVELPPTHWWTISAAGYIAVTLLLSMQLIAGHCRVRRIRAATKPISPHGLSAKTGLVRESASVTVPITIGLWNPVIILPVDWRTWDAWKLRAVLAHELAHVRRGDCAIATIAAVNTVLFWYNPLSWWLERRLAVLSEEASDDASVAVVGDAARYSEILLQFAAAHLGRRVRFGHVSMARRNIASRIERILSIPRPESGSLTRGSWAVVLGSGLIALYVAATVCASPQTPASAPAESATMRFEVASIKPSGPRPNQYWAGDCQGINSSPTARNKPGLGRCVFRGIPLKGLISTAYARPSFGGLGFPLNQIEQADGLGWIGSEGFEIQAKAETPSTATEAQLLQMLQQLLSDRFQLKLRRETREVSGYTLQIGRNGPRLLQASGQESRPGMGGGPPTGGYMEGEAVPMTALVTFLSNRLGRPMLDRTGLLGLYNWRLTWSPDESEVRPEGVPFVAMAPGPSLITAVQEQLGLRLESTRVTIEVLVVEHAERPLPN